MADFDDLFEWIEDAFEDVLEDAGKSDRSKALIGGCLFAVLATIAFGLLSSFANVFSSAGGMFLAAWLVGGGLIYAYLMKTGARRYRDADDIREKHRDRDSHEEDAHERGDRRQRDTKHSAPEGPSAGKTGGAEVGDVALLTMAGIGLALTAGFIVTGRAGASALNAILTGLLGALGAGSVLSLLLRWRASDTMSAEENDREVQAQAKRIGGKCKRLRREAKKTGGVYGSLTWHAKEMRRRARELADTVIRLRRARREIARSDNPTLPAGVSPDAQDERLQSEYEAARQAQSRLDEVMERNRRREHLCLAQLERIEDLVDAARLELTHPATDQALNGSASTVAQELETELELSRQALEEVQQQSELEA